MEFPKIPEPVYEPDPDAPLDPLPPPRFMPKQTHIRWTGIVRFEVIPDNPEPEYSDFTDLP